jgi:WD40 repeat protein
MRAAVNTFRRINRTMCVDASERRAGRSRQLSASCRAALALAASLATPSASVADMPSVPEIVVQGGNSHAVRAVAFSADGRFLVSSSEDSARLWEVATGRMLRSFPATRQSDDGIALSDDGRTLVQGGRIYDIATGRLVADHRQDIYAGSRPAISHDGRLIAIVSYGAKTAVYDLAARSRLDIDAGSDGPPAFSLDDRSIVLPTRYGTLLKFDVSDGRPLGEILGSDDPRAPKDGSEAGTEPVYAYDRAGGRYASAVDRHDMPTFVGVRDLATGHALLSFTMPRELVGVALGRDHIATSETEGTISIRPLQGDAVPVSFTAAGSNPSLAFDSDDGLLAAGDDEGHVDLYDAKTGKRAKRLGSSPPTFEDIAFSPDGRWFATARERSVTLWDLTTGQPARTLRLDAPPLALVFARDSRSLVVGGENTPILFFDVVSGIRTRSIASQGRLETIALAPDATQFIARGYGSTVFVELWDARTNRLRHLDDRGTFNGAFSVSDDGREVQWCDTTGTLWRFRFGAERPVAYGHVPTSSGEFDDKPVSSGFGLPSSDGRAYIYESTVGFSSLGSYDVRGHRNTFRVRPADRDFDLHFHIAYARHTILAAYDGGEIDAVDERTGKRLRSFLGHTGGVDRVLVSHDGGVLAASGTDGTAWFWRFQTGEPLATLVAGRPGPDDWLAVAPDGAFDGSPDGWNEILWRFDANTFDVLPPEAFFNEFFEPGLLGELEARRLPKKVALAALDRRSPRVTIALPESAAARPFTQRMLSFNVTVTGAAADATHPQPGGARDLRVFRDGTLVASKHGPVVAGGEAATIPFTIPIVAGDNRLEAYAFNDDDIRSPSATALVAGDASLARRGTAYVIAVGVNRYANERFDLRYAAPDARAFANEVAKQERAIGRFARVEVTVLEDDRATKGAILEAISRRDGSQPEDAVFLYFAGHGTKAGERFYLIPHDLGYRGGPEGLDATTFASVLQHSISDDELAAALEPIGAGEVALVIDTCHAGAALGNEAARFGPMNARGLGQLAYEKGIFVLAAAQGDQAAIEAAEFGHGLLTYSLVQEALTEERAAAPGESYLSMLEWLDYARDRVPVLQRDAMRARRDLSFLAGTARGAGTIDRSLQRPRVYYRSETEAAGVYVQRLR